jgi:DNA-binding Xre family transcriptional regulator
VIRIRLKEVLKEKNKSLFQLSYESSTPYTTLHRISKSNQRRIDLEVLSRICLALGCQPGELLIETDLKRKKGAGQGEG